MTDYLMPSAGLLYSELLDRSIHAAHSSRGVSFVSRMVKGRRYWYMQWTVGSHKSNHYLGPDSTELKGKIEQAKARFTEDKVDRSEREKLVSMFLRAGGAAPDVTTGRVMEVLEQTGLFVVGGVLVGSHAFSAIGNMLGVKWASEMTRTQDIDIAKDYRVRLAMPGGSIDLEQALKAADKSFFPVPALTKGQASTSFAIRRKQLRVDLLTPLRGKPVKEPVPLPGLGVSAYATRFLEYLLEDHQTAVIPVKAGILVNIPSPARFALHKLVVAERRDPSQANKAAKDRFQAQAILEALLEQRPGDVRIAAEASNAMPGKFRAQLTAGASRLAAEIRELIDSELHEP